MSYSSRKEREREREREEREQQLADRALRCFRTQERHWSSEPTRLLTYDKEMEGEGKKTPPHFFLFPSFSLLCVCVLPLSLSFASHSYILFFHLFVRRRGRRVGG